MADNQNITKDIACTKAIINAISVRLTHEDIVRKENLLPKETKVFINEATFNRAIRELIRLKVLVRRGDGYHLDYEMKEVAIYKLNNYYKDFLPLREIEDRLKSKSVLTREEINELLPELTIQQIDNVISKLLDLNILTKYHGQKTRGMYMTSPNKQDIFISDIIGKLSQVYDDIIICYNTALEHYNLSRYTTSRIIYVDGKTKTEVNKIFEKQIKEVILKRTDLGITYFENRNLRITDMERTIIDCIRLPKYAFGWENIFHALVRIENLNEEKLLGYLIKFKTPTLTSKVGVILENFNSYLNLSPRFYSSLNLYKSKTPFRLMRNYSGILNKHWNIYIPKNFFTND